MSFCSDIKTSELNYLIKIYEKVNVSSDGLGGYIKSWNELGSTRAKITFSAAKDNITGQVLGTASQAKVILRKSVPILKGYRIDIAGSEIQYECIGCNPEDPFSNYKQCYFRRVEHEKV